jgi:hypothetical protein
MLAAVDAEESGRLAADVLLDAVSMWSETQNDNVSITNLALNRLNEIGAITATMSDDGEITIDASDFLGAAATTIGWLVNRLADAQRRERLEILADARRFWAD